MTNIEDLHDYLHVTEFKIDLTEFLQSSSTRVITGWLKSFESKNERMCIF